MALPPLTVSQLASSDSPLRPPPVHIHVATPRWPEQVPLREWLKLKLPSRHFALAPAGALPSLVWAGACTVSPFLLVYRPCSTSCDSSGSFVAADEVVDEWCRDPRASAAVETARLRASRIA
jgi:hypothetical protein